MTADEALEYVEAGGGESSSLDWDAAVDLAAEVRRLRVDQEEELARTPKAVEEFHDRQHRMWVQENDELKAENERLRAYNSRLTSQCAESLAERDSLREEIAALKRANETLRTRIDSITEDRVELLAEVERFSRKN